MNEIESLRAERDALAARLQASRAFVDSFRAERDHLLLELNDTWLRLAAEHAKVVALEAELGWCRRLADVVEVAAASPGPSAAALRDLLTARPGGA